MCTAAYTTQRCHKTEKEGSQSIFKLTHLVDITDKVKLLIWLLEVRNKQTKRANKRRFPIDSTSLI